MDRYFEWLCDMVCPDRKYMDEDSRYDMILMKLFNKEFTYVMAYDANRYEDGLSLRNHYEYDTGMTYDNTRKCSVLEMMIALADRCEDIMDDPAYGDRIYFWFWRMMNSLGLGDMDDCSYDEEYVNFVLDRFLERNYNPDGKGGLFTIPGCGQDLRDVEIWHQMCWYLDKYY